MAWELPGESQVVGEQETVQVRRGQSLYDIARDQGYALEHLAEANQLPVSLAAVSRESVIVPKRRILPTEAPKRGVVVNIPERGFYVFKGEEVPKFFPIAVGRPGRFETPRGSYAIREKVKNPQWIAPEWAGLGEDNVIEAGPNNPLGDRWIGLTASGLGMHSTNNPSSIGSATSHGCMRMYPEVARRVFDLVETGWPVRIEYETARVALSADGVYVSCFPDVYRRGGALGRLKAKFEAQDLVGFYDEAQCQKLLKRKSGLPTRVVDFRPKATLGDGREFPAARIKERVWIESSLLEALGVAGDYRLAEKEVTFSLGDQSVVQSLQVGPGEAESGSGFLSRGSAWVPAKDVLQGLKIDYKWDGEKARLVLTP